MKIYLLSAIAGLLVLLSFQNCQKAPYQDELNNNLSTNATGSSNQNSAEKIDLSQQRLTQIEFLSNEAVTVTQNQKTFSVLANKSVQVDLATGHIKVSSDASSDVANYCLTDDLKNELLNILKTAAVCKGGAVSTAEVCTQVLKEPYSRLATQSDQFDLGSASDGCGRNAVDLCDDGATLLKGFAANLKSKLATLICQ